MKFQQKYELQEQITSGAIEVFVCEDTESGLPRLLYLLKADSPAGQLSDRDILQRVRSQGPDPAGIILELGKSEPGFHPYIVTTLPRDPLAVQRWVDAYRSFHRTGDGNGDAVEPVFGSPKKAPASLTSADPVKEPQEPTRSRLGQVALGAEPVPSSPTRMGGDAIPPPELHKDAASQPRSNLDSAPPVIEAAPGNRTAQPASVAMTGAFTKEFLAALDSRQAPKGQDANAIQRPASMGGVAPAPPAQSPPPQAPADPNSATAAFDTPAIAKKSDDTFLTSSVRPEQRLGTDSKGSQTGEFTRFMRGFDVPRTFDSPAKADTGPQFQRVDDKAPGEFTRIFGGPVSHDVPESDLNSPLNRNPSPEEKEPGPLTRILMGQSGSLEPVEPKLTGGGELNSPAAAEQPKTSQAREESGTLFSAPGANAGAKQNSTPGDSLDSLPQPIRNKEEPAGATRVFTTPGEARPRSVPVKAGPSEYTRIISGPSYSAPPPSSGGPGGAAASGTNPSLPATPAAMPSPPAFPAVQPPPLPKPAAPPSAAIPAAAMKSGGAPKPVSYWPLVIILNLLLLAAVALVLYFWLKPH